MTTVLSVAAAILAVSFLIILHEAGHLVAARRVGMRVERFSVGYGPVLWSIRRGETEFALSAFPVGGYVKIAGMAGEGDEAGDPLDPRGYLNQPPWRRFVAIAAGPFANWAFAVVVAAGLLATVGLPAPDPSATVGDLMPGMPGAAAGLRAGDRVLAVAGEPVSDWNGLVAALQRRPGAATRLDLERGGERLALEVTPKDDRGTGRVGFRQAVLRERRGVLAAIAEGFQATNARMAATLTSLVRVVKREQKGDFAGPIGIAQELARGARLGLDRFLTMVWDVSIALALLNLLPFPPLDGAKLVFIGVEGVTRRRVSHRVESVLSLVGAVLLLGAILAVTIFGDLARLLGR